MDVISHGNRDWLIALGKPEIVEEYRLMLYVSKYEVDKGYVLVNNITSAIVYIKKSEFMHILDKGFSTDYVRFLKENFFLVPLDYKDYEECERVRKQFIKPLDKETCFAHPNYFTILSTTQCNARCFYCYEKGRDTFPMTDTIAEKVGNFIVNIRDKSRPVHISWFGGEPTFNTKPMEIIYNKLIKNNIPFATSMISNGYLLDKELCDTMVDKYKLGTVQITLDGTEEVYNKAKDYIYENDESPYQVVMENIKYLCEKGVSVTIRMNLDLYNANSLKKLIPELRMRFGNYPKFGVYAYPIFEDTLERNWEHRVKVFKELEEIVYILDECNFMQGAKLHCGLKTQHCMVDGTDSILINPSGYIGLCEHYTVNHFFSHVDNYEKKNWDEVIAFRTYLEPKELCKKCPLLPNCLRIDLCHDIRYCDELTRDWRLHEASLAARNQVINYFRNMNNNMNNNMKNSCQCKPTNFKDKVKNLFKKKCNDKSC